MQFLGNDLHRLGLGTGPGQLTGVMVPKLAVHPRHQVRFRGFHRQVVVIAHQTISLHLAICFLARFSQRLDEVLPFEFTDFDVRVATYSEVLPRAAAVRGEEGSRKENEAAILIMARSAQIRNPKSETRRSIPPAHPLTQKRHLGLTAKNTKIAKNETCDDSEPKN